VFWGTNGILEGKTPDEVAAKVKLAFLPVYMKSVMVFGPTAIVSFTFVPLHLRLLVGQTVGLGEWKDGVSRNTN
jgi:protein Mpv17